MSGLRWLVIGKGRAGTIRARDITAEPGHALVHHLPGRSLMSDLHRAMTEVDAVAVCVENDRHGPLATAALSRDCHVLVEFPLCHTGAEARALFHQARACGRVLHLELIGLLTPAHAAMRAQLRTVGITSLNASFSGRLYRWIEQEATAKRWGQLAVGRLHALWDLAGPLHLDSVRLAAQTGGGYELCATLRGPNGESVRLTELRSADATRGATWTGADLAGNQVQRPAPSRPEVPLFLQDLRVFARRVQGDAIAAYVADDTIIAVAELAEAISIAAASESGHALA